jgi:hypothetical protein
MFVVGGGKCPFKVEVAEDDVLLVGVGVLHTEPYVSNRYVAGALCFEPLLFRAKYLAGINIVRGEYDYACSP